MVEPIPFQEWYERYNEMPMLVLKNMTVSLMMVLCAAIVGCNDLLKEFLCITQYLKLDFVL